MERKNIYFISDLHLGATYLKNPRSYEQRVVRWLESIRDDAAELYMLGDILDYWYEYKTVVPRGYIRFFGALASLADSGVKIYWFIGNHDIWLFDYLKNEIGLTVIDGWITKEIAGKKFFMSHGDGLGKLKPTFRLMRGMFRNKVCQKLYSAIHPRWTIPFALNWSSCRCRKRVAHHLCKRIFTAAPRHRLLRLRTSSHTHRLPRQRRQARDNSGRLDTSLLFRQI